MRKIDYGFIYEYNGEQYCTKGYANVLTTKNTIAKRYINTILSMENGKRFDGYVKLQRPDEPESIMPYPKEFKDVLTVLNYLKVKTYLIDEQPKKKTKGKYIIVKLNAEQENKLNELKALCK